MLAYDGVVLAKKYDGMLTGILESKLHRPQLQVVHL